ncbi:hypothetical protein Aduo_018364 [Ancylostoma duodenale]
MANQDENPAPDVAEVGNQIVVANGEDDPPFAELHAKHSRMEQAVALMTRQSNMFMSELRERLGRLEQKQATMLLRLNELLPTEQISADPQGWPPPPARPPTSQARAQYQSPEPCPSRGGGHTSGRTSVYRLVTPHSGRVSPATAPTERRNVANTTACRYGAVVCTN